MSCAIPFKSQLMGQFDLNVDLHICWSIFGWKISPKALQGRNKARNNTGSHIRKERDRLQLSPTMTLASRVFQVMKLPKCYDHIVWINCYVMWWYAGGESNRKRRFLQQMSTNVLVCPHQNLEYQLKWCGFFFSFFFLLSGGKQRFLEHTCII